MALIIRYKCLYIHLRVNKLFNLFFVKLFIIIEKVF